MSEGTRVCVNIVWYATFLLFFFTVGTEVEVKNRFFRYVPCTQKPLRLAFASLFCPSSSNVRGPLADAFCDTGSHIDRGLLRGDHTITTIQRRDHSDRQHRTRRNTATRLLGVSHSLRVTIQYSNQEQPFRADRTPVFKTLKIGERLGEKMYLKKKKENGQTLF